MYKMIVIQHMSRRMGQATILASISLVTMLMHLYLQIWPCRDTAVPHCPWQLRRHDSKKAHILAQEPGVYDAHPVFLGQGAHMIRHI